MLRSFFALFLVLLSSICWGKRLCRYRVKKGDTLYSIARLSRVSVKRLLEINGIKDPRRLRVGSVILVPCRVLEDISNMCPYRVRRGDSIIGIAVRLGVSPESLVEVNGLSLKRPLRVGEVLMVPCDRLLEEKIINKVKLADRMGVLKERFRVRGVSFVSPVGKALQVAVVGRRVDIPMIKGERVLAAASGRVLYVERSINGMNTFVLLKHRKGLYTVYVGRSIAWRVREGQYLKKGGVIGYALDDTVLRFWLRTKRRDISPMVYVEVLD